MLKSSKKEKMMVIFWIPHPQISLKQFLDICENVVYFVLLQYVGGQKNNKGFS